MKCLIFIVVLFSISCKNHTESPVNKSPIHTIGEGKDTIDQNKNILRGTNVLKASDKNMESIIIYGLALSEFTSSECNVPMDETPTPTSITSVQQQGDSLLTITANVTSNCAHHFLGEIEVIDSSRINLISYGYGGYASCMCCFGLTYKIKLLKDKEFDLKKIKYVSINGYAKSKLKIDVKKGL